MFSVSVENQTKEFMLSCSLHCVRHCSWTRHCLYHVVYTAVPTIVCRGTVHIYTHTLITIYSIDIIIENILFTYIYIYI